MAKGEPKVCKIDEFTYDDLVEMVCNLDDLLGDMKGKYKSLRKKHVSLQESYEDLKTSHKNLLDTHERVKEAHNSHISQEANKVKVDVGISYDLIDDISKIDKVSKSSISTSCNDLLAMPCSSNIDSCLNDSPCDSLLIDENHELRNTMDCLTKALANSHRDENTYNKMWESQRFTLKHESLGYIPKKNKSIFIDKKTTFTKECGLYCSKCKNIGHLDKDCIGSKIKHASIDPSYVLVKSSKGDVYAKFVGKKRNHAHFCNNGIGTKRKSIWVPKALVTNLQGPKQVWVSKRN
jgi:archaellum component FlaC